jgi:hypothetical protein
MIYRGCELGVLLEFVAEQVTPYKRAECWQRSCRTTLRWFSSSVSSVKRDPGRGVVG